MIRKNSNLRGKIFIFLLLFSFFTIFHSNLNPLQTTLASSGMFSEDFTTTTYMDGAQTNVTGWGTGSIENSKKKPTVVGNIGYSLIGNALDVFIDGDYAYVTNDEGLHIVNITDPTDPNIIGLYVTPDIAQSIFVSGTYAFIADHSGDAYSTNFLILDIVDPTNPTSIGNCSTFGIARDVAVKGNYAYVANDNSGLCIVDITNPASPIRVDWIDTPGTSLKLEIKGNNTYVADGSNGLVIVNITDPLNPSVKATFNSGISYAVSVFLEDNYAYIVDRNNGIIIVNVSDPSTPIFAGSWIKSGVSDDFVHENFLYVTDITDGLSVLDLTDPSNPIFINTLTLSGVAQEIIIDDIYAYIACQSGGFQIVKVIDIIPTLLDSYDTPDNSWSVDVSGDYAYVADESGGLQIVDISNPLDATFVGNYTTPDDARDIIISGNYAYIAAGDAGLQILDISDPTTPAFVGYYDTPSLATALAISGNLIYVADGAGGLVIIDVSVPSTPTLVGYYDTPSYGYGVDVDGNYAYVADGGGGLVILDVSTPSTPTLVTIYTTTDFALNVLISETYAIVSIYKYGILILDISTPSTPTLVVSISDYDFWGPWETELSGDYACVANGNSGIQIFDLSNLSNPLLVGLYNTPGLGQGVFFTGDYVYVADGPNGLEIIKVRSKRGEQYNPVCSAQSTSIFTASSSVIENATMHTSETIPSSTTILYYLSADNGINWESVTPGIKYDFVNTGYQLKWKAILTTSDISKSPVIHNLSIEYTTKLNEPSLLTPTDGFITEDYTPTFTWNSINGEANYLFQLDTTTSFSTPLLNITLPSSSTSYTPISPLAVDTYYWRVAGIDSEGDIGDFSFYRTLYLIQDVDAPTINHPSDVSYEQGATGYSITWTPADSNPNWYNITMNGFLTSHDDPWLGGDIVLNIDGLVLGTHTAICYVYDLEGSMTSDTVEIEVTTTAPPVIDDVADFAYEEGSTGHTITWHPTDGNPDYYIVTKDSIVVDEGPWLGGDITVDIDGLAYGVYTFICTVNDTEGQSASDTVILTVTDFIDPLINSPADVIYSEGETGNNIVWIATDTNPATYTVYKDGTIYEIDTWISGSSIIISVDGLTSDQYNFTIVVFDQSGNKAIDTVIVAVTVIVPEIHQNLFLGVIIISIVVVVTFNIKHRRHKMD